MSTAALSDEAVLAILRTARADGEPTYYVRNCLEPRPTRPRVIAVRRVLERLERRGLVERTTASRRNQIHWRLRGQA